MGEVCDWRCRYCQSWVKAHPSGMKTFNTLSSVPHWKQFVVFFFNEVLKGFIEVQEPILWNQGWMDGYYIKPYGEITNDAINNIYSRS